MRPRCQVHTYQPAMLLAYLPWPTETKRNETKRNETQRGRRLALPTLCLSCLRNPPTRGGKRRRDTPT